MKSILISCVIVLSLAGCNKKSNDNQNAALIASATPPAVASVAAPVAAAAPTEVSAASVPVEEDFEQKAETAITPSSTTQELDKLEKEIGQ